MGFPDEAFPEEASAERANRDSGFAEFSLTSPCLFQSATCTGSELVVTSKDSSLGLSEKDFKLEHVAYSCSMFLHT